MQTKPRVFSMRFIATTVVHRETKLASRMATGAKRFAKRENTFSKLVTLIWKGGRGVRSRLIPTIGRFPMVTDIAVPPIFVAPFLYDIKVVSLGDGAAVVHGPMGNMGVLEGQPTMYVRPVKELSDATVRAEGIMHPVDPLIDDVIVLGSEEGYAFYGMTDEFRLSLAEQRCEQ